MRDIIESVRRASPRGGFVKQVNGEWFDVGERARREKTGQQIRDLLHTSYKSSTKAKARTRKHMRGSGNERLPPRSVSAPLKSSVPQRAAARPAFSSKKSLPKRIVTLDSTARKSSAFPRFGSQRRDSEPDLSHQAGLQTIQGLNLFTNQQQNMQQNSQPLQGQMSSMASFLQEQQQPTMMDRLQLQQQQLQQQQQLLNQQQQQQQMMLQQQQYQQGNAFNTDQQFAFNANSSNSNFGMASQQASFLSPMSMGSLAQQQQQFDSSRASMSNTMSGLSHNPFLNSNNSNMGSSGLFLQQNEQAAQSLRMMGSGMRYGISTEPDLEPIMPGAVYDNDTSGSTFVDESESYEESFDAFQHGGGYR